MFLGALEPPHLILILVIVLTVFGPGKLPQVARSLGSSIREFKRATAGSADAWRAARAANAGPAALAAPTVRCGNCGLAAARSADFCVGCGASLTTARDGDAAAPVHQVASH